MTTNATDKNLFFSCETDENLEWFEKISYWIEGVFQLALGWYKFLFLLLFISSWRFILSFLLFDMIGCIGFLANLFILPVLLSNKMQNTFNQLLIFLTVFDNLYVMCSIFECIRKYHLSTPLQIVSSKYISSMSWLKYFYGIKKQLIHALSIFMWSKNAAVQIFSPLTMLIHCLLML